MKEKLVERISQGRESAERLKRRFVELWSDPENALLFRGTVGLMLVVGAVFVGAGASFVSRLAPAPLVVLADEDPVEKEASVEAAENDKGPAIGIRAIPRSISRRQDGVPEDDKDLVEPEIRAGRGLASISSKDVETPAPYNPYITYTDILASTSEKAASVGRVALAVSFEVDSHAALRELQEREKEVSFMIASLVAERDFDELRTESGRALLKQRIYQEVNYVLKKGKIRDVLYGSFVMR